MEIDIQSIRDLYDNFVEETQSKVETFNNHTYDTFNQDYGQETWTERDFVQNNLDLIRE